GWSVGWMATSVGGSAKINQPPPESTESRPSTSLKKVRSASGSRLKIIACAPEMSAVTPSVYGEARPVFTVPCQQVRRPAANENTVDLDGAPSLGEYDRTRAPFSRLGGAQYQAGEAVQAAHQESAEVGHEGANARLVGEPFQAELVRFGKRIFDEVRVAALEPAQRGGAISDARGIDAQEGRQHRPADVVAGAAQIEVDGGTFEFRVDGIANGEDPGQRLRCCSRRAPLLRRVTVVIANEPAGRIDRQVEALGDGVPTLRVRAVQAAREAGRLAQDHARRHVHVGVVVDRVGLLGDPDDLLDLVAPLGLHCPAAQ